MTPSPSIRLFERLYLGSTAVYLINALVFWTPTRETMLRRPRFRLHPELIAYVTPVMVVSLLVSVGLSLLFWFMVVRRHSATGKWLVVVTEAIGAVVALLAVVDLIRGLPFDIGLGVSLLSTALAVAGAAMLFRPDAKAWLGRAPGQEGFA